MLQPERTIGAGGRYQVLHSLGSGGFGEVVCALQTGPMGFRRKIAIKRLHSNSPSRRSEEALISEARLGGLLRHKNIVSIYNLEQDEHGWMVVMEYVEGITLTALIARCQQTRSPLSIGTVVDLAIQICAGLQHAHSLADERGRVLGLVHRDLKPSNLMLTADGLIKIMDFGIARTHRWSDPMEGLIAGTSSYMSPEQRAGSKKLDQRADIYSLGIVLFELLTLERMPSAPEERAQAIQALGSPMADVIARTLEDDPNDRFHSAEELSHTLRAIVGAPAPILIDNLMSAWMAESTEVVDEEGGQEAGTLSEPASMFRETEPRPYRGLRSFDVADQALFFGRTRESRRLADKIKTAPLVTVTGVSGVGKSSLLRAGVAPLLPEWTFRWLRPGIDPVSALLTALGQNLGRRKQLLTNPSDIHSLVRPGLVVVVDQAEELFTLCNPETAQTMAMLLAQLAQEETSRVVLVVREDFFVQLVTLPGLAGLASQAVEVLATPDQDALREVLCHPLELLGYRFEDEQLVDEIIEEVEKEAAALPLIQFCADRLWDDREPEQRLLLRQCYKDIGGVSGALAQHAEQVYQTLTPAQQHTTRHLMMKLVTPEGTRQPMRFRELTESAPDAHIAAALLDQFITVRLLNAREGTDGETLIEVVHEALIQRWARLNQWRSIDREGLVFQRNLRQAAQTWEQRDRSADLLWRGELLTEYRLWRQRSELTLTSIEQAFIAASLSRAQRGRQRMLFAGGAILIALAALSSWALQGWREADTATAQAQQAQRVAENRAQLARDQANLNLAAYENVRGNPGRAAQITARILEANPDNWLAMDGLYAAVGGRQERHILIGHTAAVRGVQFSPDGQMLLSVSMDETARLYQRDGTLLTQLTGHRELLNSGTFSPDGSLILTASRDHTARIWRLSGEMLTTMQHDKEVITAKWSPDGQQVATASMDRTVRVWSRAGELLHTLPHEAGVADLVWSQDGARLYSASFQALTGWDTTDGAQLWRIPDSLSPSNITLSPSGQRLMAFGWNGVRKFLTEDGTVLNETRCDARYPFGGWDPTQDRAIGCMDEDDTTAMILDRDGNPMVALEGNPQSLFGAHFSADGQRIALIGKEGAVSLWTDDGTLIQHLDGHMSEVVAAAWSPDSALLATGSDDNTVRLWAGDASSPSVSDMGFPVYAMAWSPDSTWLLSSASNETGETTIRLHHDDQAPVHFVLPSKGDNTLHWSPDGQRFLVLFRTGEGWLQSVDGALQVHLGSDLTGLAWHPDGTIILGSSPTDGFPRWDRDGQSLPSAAGTGAKLAWRPDGMGWAASNADGGVTLWSETQPPLPLPSTSQERVLQLCWSPDGLLLAAVRRNGTFNVWDPDGNAIEEATTGQAALVDCAWNPDGQRLAMAAWSRKAILWHAQTRTITELFGHTRAVNTVVWSPDGDLLLTTAWDTTARVWGRDGSPRWELRDLHNGEHMRARWSPDGQKLATSALGDSRIRILPGTPDTLLKYARTIVPSSARTD